MASQKLTDKLVKETPLPHTGSGKILYDDSIAGFGLRVTPAGAQSFIFNYRVRRTHRERRYTIGDAGRWEDGHWKKGAWTVARARERARELARLVDAGGDPMGELHESRAAPTVDELADRYLAEHAVGKRPRSKYEDDSLLRQWIRPELGSHKVADVEHADLEKLHRKVTQAGTPVRANRTLALASKLFACAVEWKLRLDNPARGVRRNREHARTRYLSQPELARLMAALAEHPSRDGANVIRLLALTGARRAEILRSEWSHFDFGRGEWVKPAEITKSNREHRVPLSAAAKALLVDMKAEAERGDEEALRIERTAPQERHTKRRQIMLNAAAKARARKRSPFLFPGGADGAPLMNVRRVWEDVCKTAELESLRLHDLRHSFASYLVSSGLNLPIVGALLGHSQAQTTMRYAHLVDSALRQGVDRVGSIVAAAEAGKSAEIRQLPKRGRRRTGT
jgi:integrase